MSTVLWSSLIQREPFNTSLSAFWKSLLEVSKYGPRVWVCEWYQSLTTHQHQKGRSVPKQVIMIATSIQVATVLRNALCESIRYQAKSEQNVQQDPISRVSHGEAALCTPIWPQMNADEEKPANKVQQNLFVRWEMFFEYKLLCVNKVTGMRYPLLLRHRWMTTEHLLIENWKHGFERQNTRHECGLHGRTSCPRGCPLTQVKSIHIASDSSYNPAVSLSSNKSLEWQHRHT